MYLTGGAITGAASTDILDNVDNTISGYGTIGGGGGALTLQNDALGTIDANVSGQTLLIDAVTLLTNTSLLEADGGKLEIDGTPVTNNSELLATGGGTVVLDGGTVVTNTAATVQVDAGATLDLETATISSGNVTVAGTLDSTGTSFITDATITDTGTIEATAGKLTIDPGTINNSGYLEANGGTLEVDATPVTNTGTLLATGDGTLVLNGDSGTETVTNTGGTVQVDAGATLDLETATISSGNLTVAGTLDSTGTSFITDVVLTNTGTIEATTGTLTIDLSTTITNAGTMEADDATLLLVDSVNNSGLLEANGGGTLDITGNTISWLGAANGIAGTNGIDLVGSGDTLLVDASSGTLTLNGTTADGAVLLGAGSAIIATSAETLVNFNNVITGDGTIGNAGGAIGTANTDLTLQNDAAGTIDANSPGNTLTIDTGNAVSNAGLMEATATGILDIQDPVKNSGLLKASGGSELDITGNTISWLGAANGIAGTNGIDLVGSGDTLLVDASSGTLTLNGTTADGAVLLGAGSAIIATSAETLVNFNNVITGDGTIGNAGGAIGTANTDLTLQNDAAGTIDANSPGNTLTIDTGNAVSNAGLMEATATGILDIQDPVKNSGLLKASGGSELDITGNTISWLGAANGIAGTNGIDLVGSGDTLLVDASSGTLTLNGTTADGAVLLGAGSAIIATSAETLVNFNNVITGDGTIGNAGGAIGTANTDLTLQNDAAGTIDANSPGNTLTIDTGNAVSNAGLMEATATGILDIQDPVKNSGLLKASGGSELDITGNTISWLGAANGIAGTNGIDLVGSGDTLLVDASSGTLTLNGTTADGAVLLGAGSAIIATSAETLVNFNNVITGDGTIGNAGGAIGTANTDLTLQNDAAGTIDANSPGNTLTIDTGNAVSNAGLMEATATGILDIQDPVKNSGLLKASGGSELDITGNTISWLGAANGIAGTNGIDLVGSGDTLLVDASSGTLTLNGTTADGAVLLGAGSAIIATSAETLVNFNNVITGDGTIGNAGGAIGTANTDLTLQNDAAGTIDANSPGNTLTIDTGNAVSNAGLMEATATGILDIQDPVKNSGLLKASGGSELDITGNTISWLGAANGIAGTNGIDLVGSGDTLLVDASSGTLTLNGTTADGAVLLGAGSAIIATSAETLVNFNNVITGDGTIGNAGGAIGTANTDLTLQNDAAGTIDANSPGNTLTIDTGNAVSNAGLMEATATGILDIQDPVKNSGLLKASGGSELDITGNTISWLGAANGIAGTNGIDLVGSGDTLLVDASSGTLTLNGTTADGAVLLGAGSAIIATSAETLVNFNNVITGDGTIGNAGGAIGTANTDLTLQNDAAGTIDANSPGNTLTIDTGNAVSNAGLMEATATGILDIQDPVKNSGLLKASGGSELDITGNTISWHGAANGIAGTNGIDLVGSGDTLLVDASSGTLTLNGTTADGAVLLGAGSAIIATSAETLVNFNNVITGDGTIGNAGGAIGTANTDLTLQNDAAGTIDANSPGNTLTIDTGNAVSNAGLMEATATGILDIQDPVKNSGLLKASGGSELDITGNTISWLGAANGIAGTNGIDLVGSGDTLLVDAGSGTLTLNGSPADGAVLLGAGSAIIATSAETLVNFNNVITGDGTIGNAGGAIGTANTDLTLQNDAAGTIDANSPGNTLTIDTGNAVSNAGLMEATATGILDIQDPVKNSGLLKASGGSELDITGNTISWLGAANGIAGTNGIDLVGSGDTLLVDAGSGTLTLNGTTADGAVLLGAGSAIIATSAETLVNFNNVITGDGTIGNAGGAIGTANTDLTLQNDAAGTIDANSPGNTLTIDTGNTVSNAGLMEATATGILQIDDPLSNSGTVNANDGEASVSTVVLVGTVTNSGLLEATDGGVLDVQTASIDNTGSGPSQGIVIDGTSFLEVDIASGGTLTLTGDGTVTLTGGTIEGDTTNAETLENNGNTISGYGTIGIGTDRLTLDNNAGTIDANTFDETLSIDVNTLTNELGGTIEAIAGGTLTISESVSGSANYGTIEADGGTLTLNHDDGSSSTNETSGVVEALDGGTITFNDNRSEQNLGTIEADDGTININLAYDTGSGGGNFGTIEAISGGTVNITGGTFNESGATIEANGSGSMVNFSDTLSDASIENIGTILAENGGTVAFTDTFVPNAGGTIEASGTGSTIDLSFTQINDGALTIGSGATLDIEAPGATLDGVTVTNNGTIEVNSGLLFVTSTSSVGGSGTVLIESGGYADFAVAFDQNVTFSGAGTLALAQSYSGTITGFGADDALDLTNIAFGQARRPFGTAGDKRL